MGGWLGEVEDLRIALFFIILFAVLYMLLIPFSRWIVLKRATCLLAYLACGAICLVIMLIWKQAAPEIPRFVGSRMPLQYFALFGAILGGLHVIRAFGNGRKHPFRQRNRQSGR